MTKDGFVAAPMQDLKGYTSPKKIHRVIDAAPTWRDRLLLKVLWVTGARVSEIVSHEYGLLPSDLVPDESAIILRTLKRSTKKNPKPPPSRLVVIPKKVMDELIEFSKNTPPNSRIFPISRQWVFMVVRQAGKKAGVTKVGKKGIHPHHFRHSHCVAYVKHDNTLEGLRKLQRRLNHASITTTAHYLQFSTKGEAKTIEEIFG